MKRTKPLSVHYVLRRLSVDAVGGKCYWIDPTKHHLPLCGQEAGGLKWNERKDSVYWVVGLNGIQYKRAYLVFLVTHGYWPRLLDHIDGNSLNDRCDNLREATISQNNWNHRRRKKKALTPMGVRLTPSGKYQVRIAKNKRTEYATFPTVKEAQLFYTSKRRELFGEYAGLEGSK